MHRRVFAGQVSECSPVNSPESAGTIAARLTPTEPSSDRWPAPLADNHWIDQQGNRWRIRGDLLTPKQARRLFRRPDVSVLHFYGPDCREVTGPDRDALIDRIEQFFVDAAPPMTAFAMAEFRNDLRQVTVVVQESC
jgi:hypothetical protein